MAETPKTGETPLQATARIQEALPNGLFRAGLGEDGGGAALVVHLAAGAPPLRVKVGDVVTVEIMAYDRTRGRIVGKRV